MFLERLSPELLSLVLAAANSPRDLHSLISASPPCLAIFQNSKRTILSSVLINSTTRPVLHHLLTLLSAPTFADSLLPIEQHQQLVSKFLHKYFAGDRFPMPTDEAGLLKVLRIHRRVSFLADRFFADTTHRILHWDLLYATKIQQNSDEADSEHPKKLANSFVTHGEPLDNNLSPLSCTEQGRLKRAILRFEIYCRVFPIDHNNDIRSFYTWRQQAELFIRRLRPWEIEEVVCLHQYYSLVLEGMVADIGEQLFEAVCTAPGLVRVNPETDTPPSQDDMWELADLELSGLSYWADMARFTGTGAFSYMASFGLCFMDHILKADNSQRTNLISHNSAVGREFLSTALSDYLQPPLADPTEVENVGYDDVSRPSFGWREFAPTVSGYLRMGHGGITQNPLRELGYIVWDRHRFSDPKWRKAFDQASKINMDDVHAHFTWPRGQTVEERLAGIYIPLEYESKIVEMFGVNFRRDNYPYSYDFLQD